MHSTRERAGPTRAAAPHDTSIAAVLRQVNTLALRAARWGGPASAAVYLVAFAATHNLSFLFFVAIGAAIGVSSAVRLRAGHQDAEFVIGAGGLGIFVMWPSASDLIRGGLTAALVVLAMVGFLILPARSRVRSGVFFALLIAGQLVWTWVGLADTSEVLVHVLLALTYLALGMVGMGVARRTLERSERTRVEMVQRVPIGLFRISRAGRILEANPAFVEMVGREADALLGRSVATLYDDPVPLLALASQLGRSAGPHQYEHRLIRPDGTSIWARGYVRAVRTESGAIECFEGAVEDVTQRRLIEERSRINAERFRNVFERAPIAIWEEDWTGVADRLDRLRAAGVTDLREHLYAHPDEFMRLWEAVGHIDVNPAGIALVGASSKEEAWANSKPEPPPSPIADSYIEEFVAIWDGHDHMTLEAVGHRVDLEPLHLRISWTAARDDDGALDLSHVIVAMVDITGVKQVERELADLVASKDDLIASVSHELRTPITTIMGMAFELRDRTRSFSPQEVNELIGLIADQSRELSNIVEDLLVAARSDREALAVRPEPLVVRDEVLQIVASYASHLEPTVAIPDGVLAWADGLRFRQIIRNLLTNARRYGGEEIRIEGLVDGDSVVVRVHDNGDGVSPGDEEAIFLPYVRSTTEIPVPGSIGLGLPVSRRLARLMGGDLTYHYDDGSVFELRLPTAAQRSLAV
jgi:PAS domain S-box-containing protein